MFPLGRRALHFAQLGADTGVMNVEVRSSADASWHSPTDFNGDSPSNKTVCMVFSRFSALCQQRTYSNSHCN